VEEDGVGGPHKKPAKDMRDNSPSYPSITGHKRRMGPTTTAVTRTATGDTAPAPPSKPSCFSHVSPRDVIRPINRPFFLNFF